MNDRTIRRSQTISPFGVGAVIDMLGESFVAEDITRWRGRRQILNAPRIAKHFGVDELRVPPATEDKGPGLPYYRFPQWLFCGSCRRMTKWRIRMEKRGKAPQCSSCRRKPQLVPMRFVSVCSHGHLDDVDWRHWAHSKKETREQKQCGRSDELSFVHIGGVGGGLDSVAVRCACGAQRDLGGLSSPTAMKSVGIRCRGQQPWEYNSDGSTCAETPIALQRGASSVYFPDVGSAIDIPPDSNWENWGGPTARVAADENFKLLLSKPDHPFAEGLIDLVATDVEIPVPQVRAILDAMLGEAGAEPTGDDDELDSREWLALVSPAAEHDPRDNFISRRTPFPFPEGHGVLQSLATGLRDQLERVVLVDRLREIRALRSFARHTMDAHVKPDLGRNAGFLPAVEVFGEGIFIQFNERAVSQWESSPEVSRRAAELRARISGRPQEKWVTKDVTPRLILLHTFAHLLIRQTAFDAGYSSSSLRERIYSRVDGENHAGVLVYTAAGDSEGTMGGLARLGMADRLVPIIASALSAATWCSLDPVCRESTAQGSGGLSMAACHACALASETSCVQGNVLLDRMLLIDPGFGFFAPVTGSLQGAPIVGPE